MVDTFPLLVNRIMYKNQNNESLKNKEELKIEMPFYIIKKFSCWHISFKPV